MKRRKFIRNTALTLGGIGLGTGLYAWQIEPHWAEFVEMDMPIKHLPKNLEGKTLMQISDLHVGEGVSMEYLKKQLLKAQQLKPDFVVYTGDFTTFESRKQYDQLSKVFKYRVKGQLGTFGVLGNHDYGPRWRDPSVAEGIQEVCDSADIILLRNQAYLAEGLIISGLDDYWGTNFYPQDVTSTFDLDQANLVLCHNPDVMDLDIWNNYDSWVLSGHTHGGQVKPPFLKPPILPVRNKTYTAGKFAFEDGRTLYINRALGHLHQVRFGVRPEITVFTLTRA
ncbi:MAG: metallophosphoesterase [Bacteroidota bacterium]